jgi:hypothetical protein
LLTWRSAATLFERCVRAAAGDADIRWIVNENLNKERLATLDPSRADACRALLAR